ncbi:MAG TPA: hypothetical protein VFO55_05915 [Gemmatimonadaceae bacterium]|nr:hypothetical protein [Gemmatimonadaceae bacterium]
MFQQTHVSPADSVAVHSPLPGGVAQVVRFLLNTVPSGVQIAGVFIAAAVALAVIVLLIRRRQAIRLWLATRTPVVRVALIAVAVLLLTAAGGMGAATWNYTQHSNDFCTGCHVMNPAFQEFSSDRNRHADLSCHDCHQQPLSASIRQLYLWVAERPEVIGEHAKVPNEVCARCHVTADTAGWQRVAATAGHRVHLESDSSALKGLQCVSCHGVEVHRFKPVTETCGTSGCHKTEETGIVLGKMAGQTVRHCTTCHIFTADVPALATRDSAAGTLVPGVTQCLGCHEMKRVLGDFDPRRDPHGGKCGTCHNPHTQKTPAAAAKTCASCHDKWREEPFHMGASHRNVAEQCITCHVPHRAQADASDCESCHRSVRERGSLRPPLPFDTTAALRRGRTSTAPRPPDSHGELPATALELGHSMTPDAGGIEGFDAPAGDEAVEGLEEIPDRHYAEAPRPQPPPRAAADSFSHTRHAKLACLVCHQTGSGHGRLTFERPRGCAICHHQAPTPDKCATCHRVAKYGTPKAATVTVTVPGREPRSRPVDFLHANHVSRPCTECHTTPVSLAPDRDKALCRDCHTEHHAAGRVCSSCHKLADPKAEHKSVEIAHQRCDACHTPSSIAKLTPTRTFCGTCHAPKAVGHYEPRECTTCHFLSEPAAFRPKLTTRPPT